MTAEQQQQRQRFPGVWALTDNANNLFNVRLSADGSAFSTNGVDGVPLGAAASCAPASSSSRGAGSSGAMACASTTALAGVMRS
jgi:hypothetical protein